VHLFVAFGVALLAAMVGFILLTVVVVMRAAPVARAAHAEAAERAPEIQEASESARRLIEEAKALAPPPEGS
jgi:large-conductance mechanosensitive channel